MNVFFKSRLSPVVPSFTGPVKLLKPSIDGTKQRTIRKERAIQGKSLHTGEEVTLTIKPAPPNSGFLFRRTDLYGKPEIKPAAENISDLVFVVLL